MGLVLEAVDPTLGRTVAIKVIRAHPDSVTPAQIARFKAEAKITAQLEHPNIVPVHELGRTAEGQIYFVMKRVSGRSLRSVIEGLSKEDPSTVREWTRRRLLSAFVQVCHAVGYAHDRGIVHRDLKPSNIMVGAHREVLVMDWGVAGIIGQLPVPVARAPVLHGEDAQRSGGRLMGTPGYMSPEQASGDEERPDLRSDVFSLGAILFELLTHERAFQHRADAPGNSTAPWIRPPDPRQRAPSMHIGEDLAGICTKAMGRDVERRHASATELAEAIEACLERSHGG
jgi:serine/threonine-protein kinase